MTSSSRGCLSAIQVEFLHAFFDLTQDYFLTWEGAERYALKGSHAGERGRRPLPRPL